MKKLLVLILFTSVILSHIGLYAQGIYGEAGFNNLTKINYTNSDNSDFSSQRSLSSQLRTEIGLKHEVFEKVFISFGISNDKRSYYLENEQGIHLESLFELDYLGVNLGMDYFIFRKKKWDIFTGGKFSRHVLSQGSRTDKVLSSAAPFILSHTNLLLDPYFSQTRFDFQLGFSVGYKVSYLTSFYARYNFNQSLTTVEKDQQSYNYNSHVFSFGLIFDIQRAGRKRYQASNSELTNDSESDFFIDQTPDDSSLKSGDKSLVIDSVVLKIYFPPNSTEFYDSHTKVLEQIAELLLKDSSIRYNIRGYYGSQLDKNICLVRVQSVLDFFIERGIATEQFDLDYIEEYDQQSLTQNVSTRRVEIFKIK